MKFGGRGRREKGKETQHDVSEATVKAVRSAAVQQETTGTTGSHHWREGRGHRSVGCVGDQGWGGEETKDMLNAQRLQPDKLSFFGSMFQACDGCGCCPHWWSSDPTISDVTKVP